jgi:hypothetical protein
MQKVFLDGLKGLRWEKKIALGAFSFYSVRSCDEAHLLERILKS